MRQKSLARLMLVLLPLVLVLTACGSSLNPEDVAGNYVLISMTAADHSVNTQSIQELYDQGYVATMTVRKDGTAAMDIFGKKIELTYDLGKMVFRGGGADAPFTYEENDGIISVTQDGSSMTFRRQTAVSGSDQG